MLDMTLEQGQQVFLKALAGNNFSTESIRAYSADISQFVDFLKSVRVDWNNPQKISRLDIVEFMNRLAGLRRTGTTRARKLASIRHFLKFLKENNVIAGNPAETVIRARKFGRYGEMWFCADAITHYYDQALRAAGKSKPQEAEDLARIAQNWQNMLEMLNKK